MGAMVCGTTVSFRIKDIVWCVARAQHPCRRRTFTGAIIRVCKSWPPLTSLLVNRITINCLDNVQLAFRNVLIIKPGTTTIPSRLKEVSISSRWVSHPFRPVVPKGTHSALLLIGIVFNVRLPITTLLHAIIRTKRAVCCPRVVSLATLVRRYEQVFKDIRLLSHPLRIVTSETAVGFRLMRIKPRLNGVGIAINLRVHWRPC